MVVLSELSPGSSSTHDHNHIYDVFLSFRGADTRNRFTDHLYNALLDANIKTFLDDEEIETGEPLKPELENAIKSSRASVIVLSKNYASSTWCLDELVLILEQKRSFNQIVIPIFYDVEPTNVRKQQSSFGEAMTKHKVKMETETNAEKRKQWAQKMESWKMALTEVADLKGKDTKDRKETEFIEEVVTEIQCRLGVPLSNTPPYFIGRNYDIQIITSWLTNGSCHTVDILSIVGIGGIGKTSLAKYVFQLHSSKFYKSSFIEGINTRSNERFNELHDLQKQLRRVISKNSSLQVNDVSKKVFIVLDDIASVAQLDDLLGNKGLHPGSKIIVTTKDASLTERCALFISQAQPKHTPLLLNGLRGSYSLELLCIHAFKCNGIKEGYKDVSEEVVKYCGGHPLALEVLGGSLRNRDVGYWEACINVLKKESHFDVMKALKMSFDSLLFINDKDLFKHIACFFVGMDRDVSETILSACDLNTKSGISNLIDKCLLSITRENKLMMHQLIREMGRDLVFQESPQKPWKRSRLWCPEESFKVLKQKKVTENLLGIALDMRMLDKKKLIGSFELKTESFSHMDNLMLLQLNYVHLDGCFENFPEEIRWLCMHGSALKSIPLESPMENLVALDMSYSNIESFDMSYNDPQPHAKRQKSVGSCSKVKRLLWSLKILDLSFCKDLHSVGGFFNLPALERLIVRNCISLVEVCESVDKCLELVHVDLSYCYKLKKIPISLGKLRKVTTLLLDGCNSCETQMETCGMSLSNSLNSSTAIMEAIPSDLKFSMISLLSSLVRLSLANNNLCNASFPMDLSCLSMLEELRLDSNPIVSMPSCVRTLPRLQRLFMDDCNMVISIEHPPRTLKELSIETGRALRKIKFGSEMSPLMINIYMGKFVLHPSCEIDGIVKIQHMADVDEKILKCLGWKNLEFLIERRLKYFSLFSNACPSSIQTQMYYEFGIFSTLYGEKEMPSWINCRREGPSISFTIPSSPNELLGLNFCCVLKLPYFKAGDPFSLPMIKICNVTNNHTWIYWHCIYKVCVDGAALSWLSHWMFGPNEMKDGDEITITVYDDKEYDDECIECGIGLVYDEEGKNKAEEDALGYYKSWNNIIGKDLYAFKLSTGEYLLHHIGYFRDDSLEPYDGATYKEVGVPFKAFS